MKKFTALTLPIALSAAQTVLNVTVFDNSDCTGNFRHFDKLPGGALCMPWFFEGFKLNRSLTETEQIDIGLIQLSQNSMVFEESVWNWDTSCRSVNISSCFGFGINPGLSQGIYGKGWGWNGTVWVNRTIDGVAT